MLHYKESKIILSKINKANKILLNCHRNPDPDSIGSALAMKMILKKMGKKVTIICPSSNLNPNVFYLKGYKEIKTGVDIGRFDFSNFDLFLSLDSASWSQIAGLPKVTTNIFNVAIDHHLTNEKYADLTLLDSKVTSTAELLYYIFNDWKVTIDRDVADCLMAGIVGDTGAFRYPGFAKTGFETVIRLMDFGADKDKAIYYLYRSEPFEIIKFYGFAFSKAQIEKKYKFVWIAISLKEYKQLNVPQKAKDSVAEFIQTVKGTDFGFIALETKPEWLEVSFRSRAGFNTSVIAKELGGGGHVYASGAKIENLTFENAVEKVLKVCKKYAKHSNKE